MDNLTDKEKRLPAYERVGLALKLAGVSITVTSITNMFAFLIGATSVNRIYRYNSRSLLNLFQNKSNLNLYLFYLH